MSALRKCDEETRARAVRLYLDRLRDHGDSTHCSIPTPATLRNWIRLVKRGWKTPTCLRRADGRTRTEPRGAPRVAQSTSSARRARGGGNARSSSW
jgi:translation initiation factor 2B subunit (eIF-2B alpha/beta/delta family)